MPLGMTAPFLKRIPRFIFVHMVYGDAEQFRNREELSDAAIQSPVI